MLSHPNWLQEADKESKKTRKERDPSKPKRPLSAFFLFLNERRAALLEEKKNAFEVKIAPTLKYLHSSWLSASWFATAKPFFFKWIIRQVSKIAGEEWKSMNEEKQAPYKEVHVSMCENSQQRALFFFLPSLLPNFLTLPPCRLQRNWRMSICGKWNFTNRTRMR